MSDTTACWLIFGLVWTVAVGALAYGAGYVKRRSDGWR